MKFIDNVSWQETQTYLGERKVSKDWKNWLVRKYVNANVVKQDCLQSAGVLEKKAAIIRNWISLGQDMWQECGKDLKV